MKGKRRYKAIQLLIEQGEDIPGVKCNITPKGYSIENSLFDQITMNDGVPYSNLEQGIVFSQLVDRGYNVQEISVKTEKSSTHISNCIGVASLPKKVRNLIIAGSVSGLTAVELSKTIDSEEELLAQLEEAIETAPVASDGTKKKVTKKNIKQLANVSTMKKLEEVKTALEESGNQSSNSLFFSKLVSKLKAGATAEDLLELFC